MTTLDTMLAEHIRRAAREPFQWGTLDCWLWVADWVLLRTGRDPAADMRGRYSTRAGCLRAILRGGERDYEGNARRCAKVAGLEPIAAAEIQPGDIVGLVSRDGQVGAIVTGRGYIGMGERGLWFVRRDCAPVGVAWRVSDA